MLSEPQLTLCMSTFSNVVSIKLYKWMYSVLKDLTYNNYHVNDVLAITGLSKCISYMLGDN